MVRCGSLVFLPGVQYPPWVDAVVDPQPYDYQLPGSGIGLLDPINAQADSGKGIFEVMTGLSCMRPPEVLANFFQSGVRFKPQNRWVIWTTP